MCSAACCLVGHGALRWRRCSGYTCDVTTGSDNRRGSRPALQALKGQRLAVSCDIDAHRVTVVNLPADDLARQLVADLGLNKPAQWTGAIRGVVSLSGQPSAAGRRHLKRDPPVCQAPGELSYLKLHDLRELILGESVEQQDIVKSIQELRLERRADDAHHPLAFFLRSEFGVDQEH